MKFILTEEQYDRNINYIKSVFDTVFNVDEIMFGPDEDFDSDVNNREMKDDKWEFYKVIRSEKVPVFTWYDEEEPIVFIHGGVGKNFDEEFGEMWKPIFLDWYEDNFGKKVNVIEY
jgi:hypothetical protein